MKSRLLDSSKLETVGLGPSADLLRQQIKDVELFGQKAMLGDPNVLQIASRDFSFSLAHIFIGE